MTLHIDRASMVGILRHALVEHPRECVGVVACHVRTGECRVVWLRNSSRDPLREFDVADKDVRRLYRDLDARAEYVKVVYHSHTQGVEAIPSKGDVAGAGIEDASHVIVATRGRGRRVRSWRIVGGEATEEPIVLTES